MQWQYLIQRILFSTKCFVSQIITIGRVVLGRATPPLSHTHQATVGPPQPNDGLLGGWGRRGRGTSRGRYGTGNDRLGPHGGGLGASLGPSFRDGGITGGRTFGRRGRDRSSIKDDFEHSIGGQNLGRTKLLESGKLIKTEDFGCVGSCVGLKDSPGDFRTCFSRPLRQLLATNMHRSLSCSESKTVRDNGFSARSNPPHPGHRALGRRGRGTLGRASGDTVLRVRRGVSGGPARGPRV